MNDGKLSSPAEEAIYLVLMNHISSYDAGNVVGSDAHIPALIMTDMLTRCS